MDSETTSLEECVLSLLAVGRLLDSGEWKLPVCDPTVREPSEAHPDTSSHRNRAASGECPSKPSAEQTTPPASSR
jgi:hypothetical protein